MLEECGITGANEGKLSELEESYANLYSPGEGPDKALLLLMVLGSGEYDYSSGTFTPSRNGVFWFDLEVIDLDRMYTNFLSGVSALSEGELDFENVREDTSQVGWEEGTGHTTISFEWQGEQHSLEATFYYDWFDVGVADKLNEIIIEHGDGKRLYFADDGGQGCIVFYRTPEWAADFQEETGIVLYERLRQDLA